MIRRQDATPWPRTLAGLGPIIGLGVTFGAYFVIRYAGMWSEQDTAVFINIVAGMQEAGRLTYPGAYTHGYAYPLWVTTVTGMTGVDASTLTQLYTPLIGTLFLALFSFAVFRRLLRSDKLGMAAAFLLFLVPEVVFTVARGNHEKLTVTLTLLVILAFLNSFVEGFERRRWVPFAAWVVVFYLTTFTLLTLNVLFGASFLLASTLMLVLAIATARYLKAHHPRVLKRVTLQVLGSWLVLALVMLHVSPQTSSNVALVGTAAERLMALALESTSPTVEEMPAFTVSDPYAATQTDWASPVVYQVLTVFRWIVVLFSFGTWLMLLASSFRLLAAIPLLRILMLVMYGAYGFLLALTIPVDFLNLAAGTNLQVRMYTYAVLVTPPLIVIGFRLVTARLRRFLSTRLLRTVGVGLFAVAMVLSLLKATLDPTVSNRWLFYHPAEVQAMRFWDMRHDQGSMWVDPEFRLRYAYVMEYPGGPLRVGGSTFGNVFGGGPASAAYAHALHSPLIESNGVAWSRALPAQYLENRTYDNGYASIYQRLPRTPFQR